MVINIESKAHLNKYIALIKDYTSGNLSTQGFEYSYLNMMKSETYKFGEPIFNVLQTLFSDVDSYCGDPEIANYDQNDPMHDIDEAQLRESAKHALKMLNRYLNS